jgi:hypothetical protein
VSKPVLFPRNLRRSVGVSALAVLLCSATPAWAEEDPTTTAAARERFKEGVSYFDQKQYEKARAAFLQAYALKKHPAVLLNLAHSELRSGHERDAAKHFAIYLREPNEGSPSEREAAQAGLAAAKAVLAEINVSTSPDAEILVNGQSEGTSPLPGPVYVDPGTHTIEAKKGNRIAKLTLTAKAGETKDARVLFDVEAAKVKPVAKPPAVPSDQPSTDEAGTAEATSASAGAREPFFRWLLTSPAGVISGGATVLLGLGSGGFAVAATLSYGDADDTAGEIKEAAGVDGVPRKGICTDPRGILARNNYMGGDPAQIASRGKNYEDACREHQDSVDQGDSFKTVATVAGIGAGVMAVTTVVLYFTTAPRAGEASSKSESPSVAVLPWVSDSEGGVSVFGRF